MFKLGIQFYLRVYLSGKCCVAAYPNEFGLLELISLTLTKKSNSGTTTVGLKLLDQFNCYVYNIFSLFII